MTDEALDSAMAVLGCPLCPDDHVIGGRWAHQYCAACQERGKGSQYTGWWHRKGDDPDVCWRCGEEVTWYHVV